MIEKEYYTQEQIEDMVDKLYNQIKDSTIEFSSIVAIERGGVPIAKILGEKLGIGVIPIKISFYKGHLRQETPTVETYGFEFKEGEKYLVVDDLVDSGATLDYFENNFSHANYYYVTLFWNEHGRFGKEPDMYVDKHVGKWIVFPWELEEDKK
jgi:hypoxanthine phosphoribosyltransferase